jgi:hypothetical protein
VTLTAVMPTATAAWTEGNNQPSSGLFVPDKQAFVAGGNETHTGILADVPSPGPASATAAPRR